MKQFLVHIGVTLWNFFFFFFEVSTYNLLVAPRRNAQKHVHLPAALQMAATERKPPLISSVHISLQPAVSGGELLREEILRTPFKLLQGPLFKMKVKAGLSVCVCSHACVCVCACVGLRGW